MALQFQTLPLADSNIRASLRHGLSREYETFQTCLLEALQVECKRQCGAMTDRCDSGLLVVLWTA